MNPQSPPDALDEILNLYDLSSMREPARAEAKTAINSLRTQDRIDELTYITKIWGEKGWRQSVIKRIAELTSGYTAK